LGTIVGSLITIEASEAFLDAVIISSLLLVLGLLLFRPGHWLQGKEGTLRPFSWGQASVYCAIGVYTGLVVLGSGFFMLGAMALHGNALKAFILLVVGLQSLLIFGESQEVDWAAGLPLALGSAIGVYLAAKLATQE
jgi:uncharacterized membrane protein YfcA